ncbi:MAG: cold-shock protein [Candidatus Hadarchaeia archaeon]
MKGTVKFFDERKNYGFIESEEEDEDRFVHASDIESETLTEGDEVEFDPEMGDKGPKAINVRKI